MKPSKSGEVEKFYSAKEGKKISEASPEEISQALRYAMTKIGIRAANFPAKEEKQLLILHIYENFPGNTVDEIRLAFDWGISGRLGCDINCFENFTCAYFSGVLRAYNALSMQVPPKDEKPFCPIPDQRKEYDYEEFKKSEFAQRLIKRGINIPE